MDINLWKIKIKDFWLKHEPKIVLAAGFILISAVSFEAGILKDRGVLASKREGKNTVTEWRGMNKWRQ